MTTHTHLRFVKRNGKTVTRCDNLVNHQPATRRIIGHHILPQVCGGKTTPNNIAALCDNCHYTVHIAMWILQNDRTKFNGLRLGETLRKLATAGYNQAVSAGTAHLIPKESDLT